MKRLNKSNLIETNEKFKQMAYYYTSHKNYNEVICCYEKIAKILKIEKKTEENNIFKRVLYHRLKKIKKLIKNLKIIANSPSEIFSLGKDFFFKDFQDNYYLYLLEWAHAEENDNDELFQIRESDISAVPEKSCFKCQTEISLNHLQQANQSIDVEYLKKLYKSPLIEFYCCMCFEIELQVPNMLVKNLIYYLSFLEKDIEYPIKKLCNFELSLIKEEEMIVYLKKIIKIKNNVPNNFTNDSTLKLFIADCMPEFIITDDQSIIIQKTIIYNNLEDYEKAIIFIGHNAPYNVRDVETPIPKRLRSSNFLKAKGVFYKKKRCRKKYYLTDFGCSIFYSLAYRVEEKINNFLE